MLDATTLKFAEETARAAGQLLLTYFQQPIKIYDKGERDVVTEADLAAEAMILGRIKAEYPNDKIHSEESTQDDLQTAERIWLVDPLDGTANFSIGFPHFAVAIALVINQVPEVGCVYVPVLDQCYCAKRGQGAFLNGEKFLCDETVDPSKAMLIFGGASDPAAGAKALVTSVRDILNDLPRVRIYGALAPSICYSANKRGVAGMFANYYPWDIAAAGLIAEEAGNRVTNFAGEHWSIQDRQCLSAPPTIHEYLLKQLVS